MNINRKYIIIFGALVLLLIISTGGIVYYNERIGLNDGLNENEHFSVIISQDKEYAIWCYENNDNAWNDCTERTMFLPKQLISMSVNLEKFDNIVDDSYFLCYYSDLSDLGKQCYPRSASTLGEISLIEESIPEDKETFTLLEISVYPNNSFEDAEAIVIMDLIGKLIK